MRPALFSLPYFALGALGFVIPPQSSIKTSFRDDQSVYDVIKGIDGTSKFQQLIDENEVLRSRLQDLSHKYTVFVPTDEAFDKLPDELKDELSRNPSVDFLKYHVAKGDYSGASMLALHTIPSLMHEADLGDHLQRLRIDSGLTGTEVNFYAKITHTHTDATNGAVHELDSVLIDPPRQGKLLEHLPGDFSTTRLGLEKTNLGKWLHRQDAEGSTAFMPANKAWEAVPDDVRNWLFSHEGLEYLRVVLEYHVVFDRTLYSDALYLGEEKHKTIAEPAEDVAAYKTKRVIRDDYAWYAHLEGETPTCQEGPLPGDSSAHVTSSCKIELPTVLEKGALDVEVSRLLGHVTIKLNDKVDVKTMDGVARDGVMHSIEDVLLPQRKNHKDSKDKPLLKDWKLDELRDYLKPFVEHDSRKVGGHNHWADGKLPDLSAALKKEGESLERVQEKIHHLLDGFEL